MRSQAGRAASGFVLTASLSLVLLSIADLLVVPAEAMTRSLPDVVAVLALSARGHLTLLAPFLVIQALLVAATVLLASSRLDRRWATALVVVGALGLGVTSHAVLVEYPPFRGHPPFLAAWAGLGGYLAVSYATLVGRGARRVRIALLIVGLAGAATAAGVNTTMFGGEYPALHRALITVGYLLAQAGLSLGLSLRRLPASTPWRAWRLSSVAAISLLALALGATLASARATTLYRAYTIVGSRASGDPAAHGGSGCGTAPAVLSAAEARAVFARHSNLPVLPPAFALADHDVLLVTIESTRFDETSLSGRPGLTPSLARIVDGGAFSFLDALAPSATTLQSMSSVFTQRYPSFVPMQTYSPLWSGRLHDEADTLAEVFRRSGYTTFAALHALIPRVTRGLRQGFDEVRQQPGLKKRPFEDGDVANWTIAMLDSKRASGERFFGWVFLTSPHEPYFERTPNTTDRRTRYQQEIAHADAQLGRIYDHLRTTGMLARTVLVVLSDHGEEFGEHGGQQHGRTLYREVIHIPAVVAVPGLAGTPVPGLTSSLYLFPWLLLTGDAPMRAAAEGALRDTIAPVMNAVDGAVVLELMGWDRQYAALVWPEHKLIGDLMSGRIELYDRTRDRGEAHDLADQQLALETTLAAKLAAYLAIRACGQRARTSPARFEMEPGAN